MKHLKIALLALVGAFTYQANAQESSFIVKAGVNINSATGEELEKSKSSIGYHFGASYEMPIANILSIEPGVYFDTRGFKFEEKTDNLSYKEKVSLTGVNIPILAKVKVEIGTVAVFLNAGPYAYIPFSGKLKSEKTYSKELGYEDKVTENDLKFGSEKNQENHKRFNFGLNFGAGVEVSNFVLGFGYDLGLNDSLKHERDKTAVKYNALKISVGYKF